MTEASKKRKSVRTNGFYYCPETNCIVLCLGSSVLGKNFKRFLFHERPIHVESHGSYQKYIYLGML